MRAYLIILLLALIDDYTQHPRLGKNEIRIVFPNLAKGQAERPVHQ